VRGGYFRDGRVRCGAGGEGDIEAMYGAGAVDSDQFGTVFAPRR
jgi:hypothetical protein